MQRSKTKKKKKIKKMADKERTATAAFLPRGLGKEGAKGRHSSAQSQAGCNPENPGFFPSLFKRALRSLFAICNSQNRTAAAH